MRENGKHRPSRFERRLDLKLGRVVLNVDGGTGMVTPCGNGQKLMAGVGEGSTTVIDVGRKRGSGVAPFRNARDG